MIRKLVAKFNRSIAERIVSPRKNYEVSIKIWFEPDKNTGRLKMPVENMVIIGETKDLSRSGIAFVVSAIRIKENYLVGEGRMLNAELDLPDGKVQMQIVGSRYEQVGQHISTARYLIGAKITEMSQENREVYEDFLRHGNKRKKGSLELGIDKG
ncbi:MAG: hypothetical protein ABJA66_08115 [Actinomycetota bacterium]